MPLQIGLHAPWSWQHGKNIKGSSRDLGKGELTVREAGKLAVAKPGRWLQRRVEVALEQSARQCDCACDGMQWYAMAIPPTTTLCCRLIAWHRPATGTGKAAWIAFDQSCALPVTDTGPVHQTRRFVANHGEEDLWQESQPHDKPIPFHAPSQGMAQPQLRRDLLTYSSTACPPLGRATTPIAAGPFPTLYQPRFSSMESRQLWREAFTAMAASSLAALGMC